MPKITQLQRNIWLSLLLTVVVIGILVYVVHTVSSPKTAQVDQEQGRLIIGSVLGVSENAQLGLFAVNIPAQFNQDVTINSKTLDAGKGKILASNLIYSLEGGTGVTVTGGQNPVIVNSDPGSNQNIFKRIRVGTQTITADSNSDSFEIAAANGLTLDVQGKRLTFSGLDPVAGSTTIDNSVTTIINTIDNSSVINTIIENTSGLVRDPGLISLQNIDDSLSIGTSGTGAKLAITNSSDQVGLLFESSASQTANISEWRDSNGNLLVAFDKDGNASFNGKVIQSGFEIKDTDISFSSDNQNVLLDIKTEEPDNILLNSGLENNLASWNSTTPTAINQAANSQILTNLNNWSGQVVDGSFPELLTNTGFESDFTSWNFDNGGLTTTSFNLSSTDARQIVVGTDGNLWVTHYDAGKISKVTTSGVVTEYNVGGAPADFIVGPDNAMWYLDDADDTVNQIAPNGVVTTTFDLPGTPDLLRMTSGSDGNIWMISRQDRHVFRMTLTGTFTTFNTPNYEEGRDIFSAADGTMWVATGDSLYKISGTGVYTGYTAGWACETQMNDGVDGNVWFTSICGTGHGFMTPNGDATLIDLEGDETYGVAPGPDGSMWFTRYNDNEILRYRLNGDVTHVAIPAGGYGITKGPDNNMWAIVGGNRVVRVSLGLPEWNSSPTFAASAGSLKVNMNVNYSYLSQTATLDANKRYELSCYVYKSTTDPITSLISSISVNGGAVSTTYTNTGGGWYELSSRFNGNGSSSEYGIRINPNNLLYVDNCSLKRVPERYSTTPAYSVPGAVLIESPTGNNASFTQSASFTAEPYTIRTYIYTDGSPVSSADAQIYFNDTQLSTTFQLSSTPGWYLAEATVTPTTENIFDYGLVVKSNKTVYADDFSLLFANLSQRVTHSVVAPKYLNTEGAVRINALGTSQISFTQSITLDSNNDYTIVAHAYNNTPGFVGGAIDASMVQLLVNGNPINGTSFTLSTEGFYELTKQEYLTAGTYTIGIRTLSGNRIIADSLLLQAGSGNNKTLNITNSGSGLAFLSVESTTFLYAGRSNRQALVVTGANDQAVSLTEWRDVNNNILTVVSKDGNVGIGSTSPTSGLSVVKSSTSLPSVLIINTNDGDAASVEALRLGLGTQINGVSSRFITFYAGVTNEIDGTEIGSIRLNNNGVSYETSGADFAEYFPTDEVLEFGDVVYIKSNGMVGKTIKEYEQATLGVITDTGAFVGNAKSDNGQKSALVGLLGQINVKVNDQNGGIKKGDYVAASNEAGVAAKADKSGMAIGIALEDQAGQTIKVMVRPGYVASSATSTAPHD
jgi:streptogramin lyase